ncbi:MAG: hypothetical protein ACP5RC_01735, partial [Halothiobacillaceae bacterium]
MKNSSKRFSISPVSAAVALALGAALPASAFAAGMPGLGTVTVGTVSVLDNRGNAAGGGSTKATITNLNSGYTLKVAKNSVVQWGGNTTVTDSNTAGFNLSPGSVLNVTGT